MLSNKNRKDCLCHWNCFLYFASTGGDDGCIYRVGTWLSLCAHFHL